MIATIKVADPNKVLVVGTSISDEPVKPEYKYVFKGTDPIPFRAGVSMSNVTNYAKTGIKTIVCVYTDDATGHAMREQDVKCITIAGLKAVDTLFYQTGTVDFGPIATKINALKPDLVWYGAITGEDITKITVALYNAGYKGRFDIDNLHPNELKEVSDKIGPEYLEGTMPSFYDARSYQKDPEMLKYVNAYQKEYNEWNDDGVFWVGGNWFAFRGAVDATQSLDVDVLAKYLSDSPAPVKTLTGWRTGIARPDLGNLRTVAAVNSLWKGIVKGGKIIPYMPVGSSLIYKSFIQGYGTTETYEKYWKEHKYPKFPD